MKTGTLTVVLNDCRVKIYPNVHDVRFDGALFQFLQGDVMTEGDWHITQFKASDVTEFKFVKDKEEP